MNSIVRLLLTLISVFVPVKHGHVDVVGSGKVAIKLGGHRNVIRLHFVEDDCYAIPPCGGGVGDTLEWEVDETACGDYVLDVKWSVNRPRRFVWVVSWR